MIKKKILITVLSASLVFGATQSKAFLPLFAAVGIVDATGTITASGLGLLAAGVFATPIALQGLLGQRMGGMNLETDKDGDGIKEQYRLPFTNETRDRPVANPELPPTDTPASTPSYINNGTDYQSKDTACQAMIPISYPDGYNFGAYMTYQLNHSTLIGTAPNQAIVCYVDQYRDGVYNGAVSPTEISVTVQQNFSCPSGYTLNGSNCDLTEPEKVPDKNCDLKVSTSGGTKYISNNTDPDCSGLTPLTPDGKFQQAFKADLSPDGVQPAKPYNIIMGAGFWSFPPTLTDGLPSVGNSLTATVQPADASEPAKTIKIDTVNGVVTGVSSQTVTGNIATAGTTYVNAAGQTVTVGANDLVMVVPNATGAYTVAPAGTASLTIPSDYARSGEAATAANVIRDKLAETAPQTDLELPTLENPLSSYFNPLRSWSVPVQAGSCPSGSFTWNDNIYTFDVICQLFNDNLTIIQGSMNVLYVLAALFIVLGA